MSSILVPTQREAQMTALIGALLPTSGAATGHVCPQREWATTGTAYATGRVAGHTTGLNAARTAAAAVTLVAPAAASDVTDPRFARSAPRGAPV